MNPKRSDFISIVLPCFNEMEHIKKSLPRLLSYSLLKFGKGNFELILVDDCSKDGTSEWLAKSKFDHCLTAFNKENLGRGYTVRKGLLMSKGNYSGFIDIDLEINESALESCLVFLQQGKDLVVGQRNFAAASNAYGLLRKFVSFASALLMRRAFRLSIRDPNCGLKFFSPQMTKLICEKSIFSGWFWDVEVVFLALYFKYSICELPVVFKRDHHKKSTVRVCKDSIVYLLSTLKFLCLLTFGYYKNRHSNPA